ncbi:MAG: TlpA disulfide reductase family protein [Myxococcota bacterium]|nr:TlpA disulfide reductase family protein [Myxococcota bacterium]
MLIVFLSCLGTSAKVLELESQIYEQKQKLAEYEQRHQDCQRLLDQKVQVKSKERQESEAQDLSKAIEEHFLRGLLSTQERNKGREKLVLMERRYSQTTFYRERYPALKDKITILDEPAPEDWFIQEELSGAWRFQEERLSFIVFWENWCAYCLHEMPRLQRLHEAFSDNGLDVVGVTRMTKDVQKEQVMATIQENGITYPVLRETGALSSRLAVRGIPDAILIQGGIVIWRGHPSYIQESDIARLLRVE